MKDYKCPMCKCQIADNGIDGNEETPCFFCLLKFWRKHKAIVNNDGVLAEIRELAEQIGHSAISAKESPAILITISKKIITLCTPPPPSLRDVIGLATLEVLDRPDQIMMYGKIKTAEIITDRIMSVIKERGGNE